MYVLQVLLFIVGYRFSVTAHSRCPKNGEGGVGKLKIILDTIAVSRIDRCSIESR